MRRRVIGAVIGAAIVVAAPGVGVANAPAGIRHATTPVAQTTCTLAKIGGKRKCIARGQYCARRYERQYEHYGFTCSKRDRRGRWHLQ